ncbi:unnamed protein product [Prorocentrum cordatum]|uniref:Uncharacterized protein n=1 Tax=Prorocentrum cordatum TaxID=2364126 RepID=A0ABN9RVJ0_9DINO|nr:unnamed protein product [Polarella glacialis]
MMRFRTSHSVGALLLLLVARGAPSAGSPANGTLARPTGLEGSASGRPREPQAEFGRRQATSGEQLLKLLGSDGIEYHWFGKSVAISSDGARVVVGANYYDDQDTHSGSAYVLDGATGERLLKLVASDGAGYDKFGTSVAVSSDGGFDSGSAYVLDGATGDFFGISVAVSSDGARVVVGAWGDRLLKLVASDGAAGDYFGISVAVSSDGLVASDGAGYEQFGNSVAVSSDGARVVVGAYYDDDQGT